MSRQSFQSLIFLLIFVSVVAGLKFAHASLPTPNSSKVLSDSAETPEAQKEDRYELNAKERLANLNQRIKALKARVNTTDTDTEDDYRNIVNSVDTRRMKIEDMIGQLHRVPPSSDAPLKKKIDTALNDLAYGVDRTEKNVQQ
jgi:uncharacterized protein YlxW (UPF0749 family)